MRISWTFRCPALFAAALLPTMLHAQGQRLLVTSVDGMPIPLASVWVGGGQPRFADSAGVLLLGGLGSKPVVIEVRRMGFSSWRGEVTVPDTGLSVQLTSITQKLETVTIAEHRAPMTLALQGFYRRAVDRQKGVGSGTFISPEMIERRNPNQIADLLREVNGITLARANAGGYVALGKSGMCKMSVIVDGIRVRSPSESIKGTNPGMSLQGGGRGASTNKRDDMGITELNSVILDRMVSPSAVAAVEIYPRASSLPTELEQPSDAGCGVIAIWTGARR